MMKIVTKAGGVYSVDPENKEICGGEFKTAKKYKKMEGIFVKGFKPMFYMNGGIIFIMDEILAVERR